MVLGLQMRLFVLRIITTFSGRDFLAKTNTPPMRKCIPELSREEDSL